MEKGRGGAQGRGIGGGGGGVRRDERGGGVGLVQSYV